MRSALSPILHEVVEQIRLVYPAAEFFPNLYVDNFSVHLDRLGQTFNVSPILGKYDSQAVWPLYVTPIPSPRNEGAWECATVAQILEALQWPDVFPKLRICSVAEMRELSGTSP